MRGQISGDRAVMQRNLHMMFGIIADEFDVPESIRLRARELAAKAEADAARPPTPSSGRLADALSDLAQHVTWVRAWRLRHPPDIAAAFPGLRRAGRPAVTGRRLRADGTAPAASTPRAARRGGARRGRRPSSAPPIPSRGCQDFVRSAPPPRPEWEARSAPSCEPERRP